MVEAHRRALGIAPRDIGSREIVERCVFALVNEGARIVDEGIAQRASDIDIVYVFGYGFPAWRGGPMQYADSVGLINVERAIQGFARGSGAGSDTWRVAPLLSRLAAEGKTFNAASSQKE